MKTVCYCTPFVPKKQVFSPKGFWSALAVMALLATTSPTLAATDQVTCFVAIVNVAPYKADMTTRWDRISILPSHIAPDIKLTIAGRRFKTMWNTYRAATPPFKLWGDLSSVKVSAVETDGVALKAPDNLGSANCNTTTEAVCRLMAGTFSPMTVSFKKIACVGIH